MDRWIPSFDRVRIAMPPGGEGAARDSFADLLGLAELKKPSALAGRGGAWFALPDGRQLHLGVEEPFRSSRKAHPVFVADDLDELARTLEAGGHAVEWDDAVAPDAGSTARTRSATGCSSLKPPSSAPKGTPKDSTPGPKGCKILGDHCRMV